MDIDLTVVCVSDAGYFDHVVALASSLWRHHRNSFLHAHLINVDARQSEILRAIHNNVSVEFEHKQFHNNDTKRAYCANRRAEVLSKLLREGRTCLLYLDADSIVRNDLSRLVGLIRTNDLVILQRPACPENMRFLATLIGIRNSSQTQCFIDRWAQQIEAHPQEWYNDQIFFARTYDELASTVQVVDPPREYVDWEYFYSSNIWVGKGARKLEDRAYRLEEEYYLRMAHRRSLALTKMKILGIQALRISRRCTRACERIVRRCLRRQRAA